MSNLAQRGMNALYIYTLVVAGAASTWAIYRTLLLIVHLCRTHLVTIALKRLLYPFILRRRRLFGPLTRLEALVHLLHWGATVACNVIGVSTTTQAGSRAGSLAIIHLIPLFFGSRLSFAADLLGITLRTYVHMHGSIGVMEILQTLVHVVLVIKSSAFDLQVAMQRYGFIACFPRVLKKTL